jgi:hypothetical protein
MVSRITHSDDEKRCRGVNAEGGQCRLQALEGQERCEFHGGKHNVLKHMNDYLTEQFANRVKLEIDGVSEVELLRENLLSLNQMIAARRALITDEGSLLSNTDGLTKLITAAEKVTISLNRLAIASGLLLAKPALITWGQQIVQAVAELVEDKYEGWEDDLVEFADTVGKIIVQAKNTEEDE